MVELARARAAPGGVPRGPADAPECLNRPCTPRPQVKYMVELARARAQHPAVFRVDLLMRLSA